MYGDYCRVLLQDTSSIATWDANGHARSVSGDHWGEEGPHWDEDVIPGNSPHPYRLLRSGVVTSDSQHRRAHTLHLRMDQFLPAVINIEKVGVFPVSLQPKPSPTTPIKALRAMPTEGAASLPPSPIALICQVLLTDHAVDAAGQKPAPAAAADAASAATGARRTVEEMVADRHRGGARGGKIVVIRSPVVLRNSAARALEIKFGEHAVPGNFEPSADQELPLELMQTAGYFGDAPLMVRPYCGGRVGNLYTWSRRKDGKTLSHMRQGTGGSFEMNCVAVDGSSADFVLSVYVVNSGGQTFIEFLPPLVIENALASDCHVYMRDQHGGNVFANKVERAGKTKVHEVDMNRSSENTLVITTAGFTGELRQAASGAWPEIVRLRNRENRTLAVAVEMSDGSGVLPSALGERGCLSTGAAFIVLYTTHWILDYSKLGLEFAQQGVGGNICTPTFFPRPSAQRAEEEPAMTRPSKQLLQGTPSRTRSVSMVNLLSTPPMSADTPGAPGILGSGESSQLHMFSFLPSALVSEVDETNEHTGGSTPSSIADCLLVRSTVGGSCGAWSVPVTIGKGSGRQSLASIDLSSAPEEGDGSARQHVHHSQVCRSVCSAEGVFHRTKLVTFYPSVFLTNRTRLTMLARDAHADSESECVTLAAGQASPFHWRHSAVRQTNGRYIAIRTPNFEWSQPLHIDHTDDFYIFVRGQGARSLAGSIFRVIVKIDPSTGAKYLGLWLDTSYGELKIVNNCKHAAVSFSQYGIGMPPIRVGAEESLLYAWENPKLPHRLQIHVGGFAWDVDFHAAVSSLEFEQVPLRPPLQFWLFPPELQWRSRGKMSILPGFCAAYF